MKCSSLMLVACFVLSGVVTACSGSNDDDPADAAGGAAGQGNQPLGGASGSDCSATLSDGTELSGSWAYSTGPGSTTPVDDSVVSEFCDSTFQASWPTGSQSGTAVFEGSVELDGLVWEKVTMTTTGSTGDGPDLGWIDATLMHFDLATSPITGTVVDNYSGEGGYPTTTLLDHVAENGEPQTAEGYGIYYLVQL